MLTSINCKFPQLNLLPNHKHSPLPSVPCLDGFYGNLQFEPWTDFHEKLRGAYLLAHIHASKTDAIARINTARSIVQRTPYKGQTHSSTLFPDCSSLSIVHHMIMSGVERFLKRVRATRKLGIRFKDVLPFEPSTLWNTMSIGTTPHFTLMSLEHDTHIIGTPICAFNLHGPCFNILASNEHTSENPPIRLSAEQLCSRYSALFSPTSMHNQPQQGNNNSNPTTAARSLVAHALSCALSVQGGCVFLSNYDVGVALKVVRNNYEKVVVKASRPFYRDEEMGPVFAMIALSIYSMNRLRGSAAKHITQRAEKIANAAKSIRQRKTASRCGEKRPRVGDEPPQKRARSAPAGSIPDESVFGVEEARRLQPRVLLGSGNSGTVFLSVWNGKGVAIKQWNGVTREGLECMVDEVSIVASMKKQCPGLFGTVIPKVLLAVNGAGHSADDETNGPVIVTEFVGESVFRDAKGELRFGDIQNSYIVNEKEERDMYEAARHGLGKLHAKGFLHGSVNLRNLRVDRTFQEDFTVSSAWKWRVWWIDFGRTSRVNTTNIDTDLPCFSKERRQCRQIFRTRAPA